MREWSRRTVIVLKVFDRSAFSNDTIEHTEEHRDPGPAKTINGLFRIADDHQLSRNKSPFLLGILGQ